MVITTAKTATKGDIHIERELGGFSVGLPVSIICLKLSTP